MLKSIDSNNNKIKFNGSKYRKAFRDEAKEDKYKPYISEDTVI